MKCNTGLKWVKIFDGFPTSAIVIDILHMTFKFKTDLGKYFLVGALVWNSFLITLQEIKMFFMFLLYSFLYESLNLVRYWIFYIFEWNFEKLELPSPHCKHVWIWYLGNGFPPNFFILTLLWRRSLSYRIQSIGFLCKSMHWFLYDGDFRHERV